MCPSTPWWMIFHPGISRKSKYPPPTGSPVVSDLGCITLRMNDDFDEADEMVALVALDLDDAEALATALACLMAWAYRHEVNFDAACVKASEKLSRSA